MAGAKACQTETSIKTDDLLMVLKRQNIMVPVKQQMYCVSKFITQARYFTLKRAPVDKTDKCIIIFTQFYHILAQEQVHSAPF